MRGNFCKFTIIGIVLLFILISGAAVADRLPHQVPENQKISISTIIDVVGYVSDSSYFSWTIDYSETPVTGIQLNSVSASDAYILTDAQVNALAAEKSSAGITYSVGLSNTLNSLTVPDYSLDNLALPDIAMSDPWWGKTWRGIINSLDSTAYSKTDDTLTGSIHNGKLLPGESIAVVTYSDSIRTNGGHLMLNKDINFDSQNKGNGLNNLEAEKVLTYESIDGSILVGSEEWSLDVAGNYADTADSIRCVFTSAPDNVFPAFCNTVKAKSELVNFKSGQVSTKGGIRAVAASGDVPAGLFYQIAVTPNADSPDGYAEGTVRTSFAGSIMEARGKNDVPSATNQWSDKTSVSGSIRSFQKSFEYESGISL